MTDLIIVGLGLVLCIWVAIPFAAFLIYLLVGTFRFLLALNLVVVEAVCEWLYYFRLISAERCLRWTARLMKLQEQLIPSR